MPRKDLYTSLFDEPSDSILDSSGDRIVPNVMPSITNVLYKIAIVGEAPGADEVEQGIPFVGWSGRELTNHMSRLGILRDACFIGNICQHRPPGNKIAAFDWDGPQIQSGIRQLSNDLKSFRPNIVLCLGGSSLHAFRNPNVVPKKRKTKDGLVFVFPDGIGDWRGSFFESHPQAPLGGVKCIASYHPAACLRQYKWMPLMAMDIKRCLDEATKPELVLPARRLLTQLSFEETLAELDKVILNGVAQGTDIEGYWNNWSCISFASSPDYSFIVPLTDLHGGSYWTVDQEFEIWKRLLKILDNPKIPKTWQNGLYDRFCIQHGYGICVRGPNHDIMLKHWELYCELEKALSVQCSLYTREPYYKTDRHAETREDFWRYCCKDSAVTIEIDQKLDKWLTTESRRHYDFNLTLLNALLYMELRGIRYDVQGAKERLRGIETATYEFQYRIDKEAGLGLGTEDKVLLRAILRDTMCWVRNPSKIKKGFEVVFDENMRTLLGEGSLTKAQLGKLSIDITRARSKITNLDRKASIPTGLNIKGKQLKEFLYGDLDLEPQYNPITGSVTVNYHALLSLCKKNEDQKIIPVIIEAIELNTRAKMLRIKADEDGRVRSTYNEVGSETGRVTSGKSPTGSGYNLQTIPDENEIKPIDHPLRQGMRDLLRADGDCYIAKCDLKGADGWTVSANLAALGDSTMLDDLRAGIKPAARLCWMMRHGLRSLAGKPRDEVVQILKAVKKSDWDYFAWKQCIWGFCYLLGARKASQHVFNVSEGAVLISEDDMTKAKNAVLDFYGVRLWWTATERRLMKQPYPPKMTSPSGHTRKFFGRRQEILGEALAHEPQSVTTYATNMAMHRLWTDPENREYRNQTNDLRTPACRLRIEPLHQVHDEMVVQFRKEDVDFAKAKIRQWFNNPIRIAGIEVTIPYDGVYGTDWGMAGASKIGEI